MLGLLSKRSKRDVEDFVIFTQLDNIKNIASMTSVTVDGRKNLIEQDIALNEISIFVDYLVKGYHAKKIKVNPNEGITHILRGDAQFQFKLGVEKYRKALKTLKKVNPGFKKAFKEMVRDYL